MKYRYLALIGILIILLTGCYEERFMITGKIRRDYDETNEIVECEIICKDNHCGNEMYYEQDKGCLWLGLQNITSISIEIHKV